MALQEKKKGIMGLAGFLKPLNCNELQEIATWMHLKKPEPQFVQFQPDGRHPGSYSVDLARPLSQIIIAPVLMTLAATIESWELYALILGFAITCIMAGPLHVVRHLVRDLRQMPIQIKNFTFLESQCFCCSENHLSDGRPIPCDRDIISDKLEAWFGPSSSGVIRQDMAKELYVALSKSNTRMTAGESAQDLFNRYVQEVFGHYLLRKVGGSQVKYSLAMAATLPACFYICDRFHLLSTLPVGPGLRLTFFYASVVFAFFPVLVRSSSGIAHLADYLFGIRERKLLDFLVTLVALLALAATTFSWLFVMDYTLFHEEVAYQVLAEIATVSLTVFLYRTELVCCHKRKRLSRLARRSTAKRFPSRQPSDPIEDSRVLAKLSKCSSWQQSTLSERPPQIRLGGKTLPDLRGLASEEKLRQVLATVKVNLEGKFGVSKFPPEEGLRLKSPCPEAQGQLWRAGRYQADILQSWNASAQDALAGSLPGQTTQLHTPSSTFGSISREQELLIEVPQTMFKEKLIEVPTICTQEVVRAVPKVEVHEIIKEVPKIEYQVTERVVEVPEVRYVEKIVEVPEVHTQEIVRTIPKIEIQEVVKTVPKIQVQVQERLVEVPKVCHVEKVVEVPQVHIQEVVRTVPRLEVQEIIREVPKVEVRTVERLVEVPQVAFVDKFVEVPQVQVQEVLRHVPKVEVHEIVREVPKIHMEYREKIVEVPQVHLQERLVEVPKIEVREILRTVPKVEVRTVDRLVEAIGRETMSEATPRPLASQLWK
ncbi:unnamed protein product [Effrenium voratum]|nr:unnamed protein product [Effrenium voratum]